MVPLTYLLRRSIERWEVRSRFEVEVAHGAKLFYLSALRHGKYLKREVLNLARFISVAKTKPLSWRLAHPYLIADRFEVRAQCHSGSLHRLLAISGPGCHRLNGCQVIESRGRVWRHRGEDEQILVRVIDRGQAA